MAERTPPERNRYVDFLRAVSICAVVFGHWLMATAYRTEAGLEIGNVLAIQAPTQWLSWAFQVMPVFFMGGLAGSFFEPLALSYLTAMVASTVVALTVTPAAASSSASSITTVAA